MHFISDPPQQAHPRRRSADFSNSVSPQVDIELASIPKSKSPAEDEEAENLSIKRPRSSPGINLVKTELLLEAVKSRPMSTTEVAGGANNVSISNGEFIQKGIPHFATAGHHEDKSRMEALQVL